MAGHSKWNNIKKRKGAVDAKKGKVFGHLARGIRMAVKEGGSGDPQMNPSLRPLLDKARAENMPKEKIQKAIDVGLGKGGDNLAKEVIYEGYGPGGVGLLIVAVTDNTNRTGSEIKMILSKGGGSLGSPGSAMYLFTRSNDGGYISSMPYVIEEESVQVQIQNLIDSLGENDDIEEIFCSGKWEGKE